MLSITIKDPIGPKYYRARVSYQWANRHDNGALISCGLTINEPSAWSGKVWLTRRAFNSLRARCINQVTEITEPEYQHSGCQSSCTRRGDAICRW